MNAADISGFCDLNITHCPDEKLLERILEYDYRAIALNWTVNVCDSEMKKGDKRKIKGGNKTNSEIVVLPDKLNHTFKSIITKNYHNLRVFLRITIIFRTPEQLKVVLASPLIKQYDIIAVIPATTAAYEHACTNPVIDLISFEVGVSNYKPNGKMHRILVNRSGYFEISYCQALQSSSKRQEVFTMTQYFSIYGKSKNAIISSGASHYLQLRNPFDVANLYPSQNYDKLIITDLQKSFSSINSFTHAIVETTLKLNRNIELTIQYRGLLFGLSNEMAKKAVSHNCKMLLLVAAGRKYGKTAITVELMDECEEPSKKRAKLFSKDELSSVTHNISSLSTNESSCS